MAKTVTATEAKNRLGALMNEVIESNEPVIIELRGRPKIAMITRERLEAIEETRATAAPRTGACNPERNCAQVRRAK